MIHPNGHAITPLGDDRIEVQSWIGYSPKTGVSQYEAVSVWHRDPETGKVTLVSSSERFRGSTWSPTNAPPARHRRRATKHFNWLYPREGDR